MADSIALQATPNFLEGGGTMGAIMRAHDWSTSSLGPPQAWPQALRTAVRLLLNTGHPMYIWWGADGACLYNDAYSLSIGPERHPGSLGRPAREVWAEIWDIIGPQIEQVMAGRGPTWHENHLVPITRNGRREDVYWTYSFSPIDDDTAPGGVGGVLVVCTETTQQVLSLRRSAEELERYTARFEQAPTIMAERLASIVESSDDAIISKDLNGIIRSWNGGAERIFGYTADEVIGKHITILIPTEKHGEEPAILGRIIKGERVDHYETIRQRKDGSLLHISLTVSPIRDSEGTIVGASKVGRDITESRRARERQNLLFKEMNHRVKNSFAVASGVVSVSARLASSPRELASAVQARLGALARAHDLTLPKDLDDADSRKARLSELIQAILAPYDTGAGHIEIAGPEIECGPTASTAFALLLNEFATNSVKYGALAEPSGRVAVQWSADGALRLVWSESGIRSAPPPADKQGFGGVLVDATVAGLRGTFTRDWLDGGLRLQLEVPLDRIGS